jgi:hypothetical protein
MDTYLESESLSKHGVVGRIPSIAAAAVLTGEVCKACNGGWMQELDESVDHVVMGLAQQPPQSVELSSEVLNNLARCLLMHACCFTYTEPPERRHVPRKLLEGVQRSGFVPDGFFMFGMHLGEPAHQVNAGTSELWPNKSRTGILQLPQSSRMKFGMQYDSAIFGFAWADVMHPGFVYDTLIHFPLLVKGCRLLATNRHGFELPPQVMTNKVTRALAGIGVRN